MVGIRAVEGELKPLLDVFDGLGTLFEQFVKSVTLSYSQIASVCLASNTVKRSSCHRQTNEHFKCCISSTPANKLIQSWLPLQVLCANIAKRYQPT